jgi:hypothetical protein
MRAVQRSVSPAIIALLVAGSIGLFVGPAEALSQIPTSHWGVQGKVYAMTRGPAVNVMYVGGKFGQLVATDGSPSSPASSLAAFSLATGEPDATFRPTVSYQGIPGTVKAIALSPDGAVLYIGGRFDAVNEQPVDDLAAISTSTGQVISTFSSPTLNQVNTILVNPSTGELYIGGSFLRVNAQPRGNLAALFPDGTLDPAWTPSADDNVRHLSFAPDGNSIFVAGHFTTVDGQARQSVARLNLDGSLNAWTIPAGTIVTPMTAFDTDASSTRLYVGFGQQENFVAAFRLDDGPVGDKVWLRHTPGNVESVALSPNQDRLFFGGHFGTASGTRSCGTYSLHGLASLDVATGEFDCSWLPHLFPDKNNYTGGWTMTVDRRYHQLWVGGFFDQVCDESGASCVKQHSLGRFPL